MASSDTTLYARSSVHIVLIGRIGNLPHPAYLFVNLHQLHTDNTVSTTSAKEQKTYPNLFAPLDLSSLFQVPSFFPTYFDDISSDHPIIWQGYIEGDTRTTPNSADVRRDPTYVELFVCLAGRLK